LGGLPGTGRGDLLRAVRGGDPRDPLTAGRTAAGNRPSPPNPEPEARNRQPDEARPSRGPGPRSPPAHRSRRPFPGAGPTTGQTGPDAPSPAPGPLSRSQRLGT